MDCTLTGHFSKTNEPDKHTHFIPFNIFKCTYYFGLYIFVILWENVFERVLLLYIFKFAICRFIGWQFQECVFYFSYAVQQSAVDMTIKTNMLYFLANILYILHSHLFICKYLNLNLKKVLNCFFIMGWKRMISIKTKRKNNCFDCLVL